MKFGVIGFGNMGGAIVRGALKKGTLKKEDVNVYDILDVRNEEAAELGLHVCADDEAVCAESDIILLAVKPQQMVADKKAELGTSAMKDFAYHTAHIYCAVTDAICKSFPDDSHEIIRKAVADYIDLFGQEDYDALLEFSPEDFQRA